ncbi:(3S)-malyl-CoA thioesterase [Breoghania corrubedonensis]|uniref:(3S)-malyl-CoA thioesterase n=1 Tax=Breoghania corrubedonensis TaxID=665038 RepID=A0A2T5V4V2_9HYPH|nr:thioesterase family protein [Breoghania corrubedonensis]PTW58782.1 (3S)-malyl-CoA thioesterase [Breoghania corrubedonensis]
MPNADVPFRSSTMRVEEDWIDYNGHLNMAYYNVLFDRAIDEAFINIGLGPDYVKKENASYFTAETHLCYIRELSPGDEVSVTTQIVGFDAKRIHAFQELHHADGWLSATSEQMSLHVDMKARKVAPFPPAIADRLAHFAKLHEALGRPERAGRSIGLPAKR